MWTYNIKDKKIVNGVSLFTVEFSDGATVITKDLAVSSLDTLKLQIKAILDQCQASDTLVKATSTGTLTDLTVSTPDNVNRGTFFANLQKLRTLQNLIDLGVITAANPDYLALKKTVVDSWNINYLS